jgi:hypothetical protein
MLATHTLQIVYNSPTGQIVATLTGSGNSNVEENLVIAPNAAAAETDMTILYATLQSFCIQADAAMTVVFKAGTGGSGTTAATFTLVAGVPQFWTYGNGTNPFTGNAGQMLVTSTPGGNLKVRAVMT